MNYLVSIIIPCFNREKLVERTLNSLLEQTYINWECIVVDDGSTDGTIEVLKAYSQFDSRLSYKIRKRLPKGAPTCRNIGLSHAKGEFIMFLDSDDYLMAHCLEHRVGLFKENSQCDFLVFPMAEEKGEVCQKVNIPFSDDYLINFLSANLPWQITSPIWKGKVLKRINGFSEEYPRFNDPELMIRTLIRKHEIKYKVFNNEEFDCVFIHSPKNPKTFKNLIYKSLKLLIPDTVANLKKFNSYGYRFYLMGYLHYWFKYVYVPSNSKDIIQSMKILNMFKTHKIISSFKWMDLMARLIIYITSKLIMSKPIDKLTQKAVYIKHK